MGTRENKVETYLKDEVKKVFGGITRKWVSPGHDGVHDQIVFLPGFPAIFVEVKTTDGGLSMVQKREHERLRRTLTTSLFWTVYGHTGVDSFIKTFLYESRNKKPCHPGYHEKMKKAFTTFNFCNLCGERL